MNGAIMQTWAVFKGEESKPEEAVLLGYVEAWIEEDAVAKAAKEHEYPAKDLFVREFRRTRN